MNGVDDSLASQKLDKVVEAHKTSSNIFNCEKKILYALEGGIVQYFDGSAFRRIF